MTDGILFVSDLHCGSTRGLLPPDHVTLGGDPIAQLKAQAWTWACWSEVIGWAKSFDGQLDVAVLGDAIQGNHFPKELVTHDMTEQAYIAECSLRPLRDACCRMWMVRGTNVHVRNMETIVGRALDCMQTADGDWCHKWLKLDVDGCRIKAAHHVSTGTRPWTKGGGPVRMLTMYQQHAIQIGEPPPHIAVGAHKHEFEIARTAAGIGIVLPPWQMTTGYARERCFVEYSIPGAVLFDFRRRDADGMPDIQHRLFRPKPNPYTTIRKARKRGGKKA